MFIPWVRGGAYFLHFAAGSEMSFCKLREKREMAARWVTCRGGHRKPRIQLGRDVCSVMSSGEEILQVLLVLYCQALL